MEDPSLGETISLLSELIRNRCVNPPGEEMRSILTVQRTLAGHGVEARVFESAPGRGNLIARIPGSGSGPSLMLGPSHVDVVPVESPDAWEVDPFLGTVRDGYVWGRGALDMLFIVAAQVQAFARLHDEGFRPRGDLLLLVVSDEEAGGGCGTRWMVEKHPDLVRADYAVTEAGGITVAPGRVLFMAGEKGVAAKRVYFRGRAGHGSMPQGADNAIAKMGAAASRIAAYSPPATTEHLVTIADGLGLGPIQRVMLTTTWLLPLTLRGLRGRQPTMAALIHGLSRMTMSPNVAQGGVKVNVIPEKAYLDVDIRTLPGQDDSYVTAQLRGALGPLADEALIEDLPGQDAALRSYGSSSLTRSPFVEAMERAVRVELPGARLVPLIMPGATDCRFLRGLGTAAYGFSLFDPETPTSHLAELAHGANERVSIKTLDLTRKVYYSLAKDFLR